jgi:hypothetical protein
LQDEKCDVITEDRNNDVNKEDDWRWTLWRKQ